MLALKSNIIQFIQCEYEKCTTTYLFTMHPCLQWCIILKWCSLSCTLSHSLYLSFSFSPAVKCLKYCRYDVKHYPINRSIDPSIHPSIHSSPTQTKQPTNHSINQSIILSQQEIYQFNNFIWSVSNLPSWLYSTKCFNIAE